MKDPTTIGAPNVPSPQDTDIDFSPWDMLSDPKSPDLFLLLGQGYLPEVLPPVFTSKPFADLIRKSQTRLPSIGKGPKNRTKIVNYSATKRASQRRIFGLHHPETFYGIARFLSENWGEIDAYFGSSIHSVSLPKLDKTKERAISITSHKKLAVLIYRKLSSFRYTVKTDISRFYPSIYTHSISWAMHGKTLSKEALSDKKNKSLKYDALDVLIRQSQDGQSIGLPVGPDTSRIVAEMIAVAVDKTFSAHLPRNSGQFALIRHVDDVWIGTATMDDAEAYLGIYRESLREFGLDINELKTSIVETSQALDPAWPLSLKLLIKREFRTLNVEDKTKLLAEVFRMAVKEADDGIVKYAIRRFDRENLWLDYWNILQEFLIRSLTSFPHSIDYVARVVIWMAQYHPNLVEKTKWGGVLIPSLQRNSALGNDSEVCWILWVMDKLGISVGVKLADQIISRCGAFPIVMLCHLKPRLLRSVNRQQKLLDKIGNEPFRGSFWLLAYEAVLGKWIAADALSQVKMSAFMNLLLEEKISFFDRQAGLAGNAGPQAVSDNRTPRYAIEDMAGRYDDDDDYDRADSDGGSDFYAKNSESENDRAF